ncbi:hypothetical protein BASA50_009124 [Batrachochytrium salamandrivorans]|uniref:Intraflagellar transport protein 122 homolog n=1 Tax=Batrachochytrium salamandrivorans TaxID=1357716 RepID=A0ABQ8F2V9_9FUNG|nr:hypothetical protein BASA62_000679 [Batrachochytrium salamandrivorans]KAH6591122.1 hypothetical protein BASA50_009124 [Batrachochytrium salamandrivorans]KAH9277396.1 hypothetical protein BASA83_000266 [Batrachochytrium salamandrivorans]KAJ1343162.1 hypothetical protein BSLG_002188 [Batrachochytrium salamandrivorans]
MRPFQAWSDKVQDASGTPQPIYDVIYTYSGEQLVACAGVEVLVYDATNGEVLRALKGHKDAVLCLCPLQGNGFASGSADKHVIIWNNKWEGTLKYSHNDTIQSVSQNQVTGVVLSCTASDFGLWAPDIKAVNKTKVPSRILCSSWTLDGQHFALGLYSGNISIRSRIGEEKIRIERGASPIWSLSWSPAPGLELDILAVTDWSQRLSFFQVNGRQIGKDRQLGFDPCSVNYFPTGEYLIIGGADKKVHLWTPDGIRIGTICDCKGWVWSCKVHPKKHQITVGTNDGTVSVHDIQLHTVHGLFNDQYAFRHNMTDVIIQHLTTHQKARIKCRDYVKKIAVYNDRLAVQLVDRVIIYELFHDEAGDMHYRIKEKLHKNLECSLLVVTSNAVILCLEKKLQMYSFVGEKEREWRLDALIRYIKVIGGPRGREGLLVGLQNGHVVKLFVDSAFPISTIKQNATVRCLDLNLSKSKIAIVDEQNTCRVYCMKTKTLLYQEPNVDSVAWNSEVDDMLCYAGNGILNVKVGQFPAHQQKMDGLVVGFKGARVFCLNIHTMSIINIPQTAAMDNYIENGEWVCAYRAACLGASEADWRRLALEALEKLQLEVSKQAFIHIRDFRFLEVIRAIEKLKLEGCKESDVFSGQVSAYAGKYHEAARLFKRAGHTQMAIEMYIELNMWDFATHLSKETDGKTQDILLRKAQVQEDRHDTLAAAATYEDVGDFCKAIGILGPAGLLDRLIAITRKLDKTDTIDLGKCAYYFRKHNHHAYAIETYIKMGDFANQLQLYIDNQQWDDAFLIGETHPEFNKQIYLPYGHWLAMNDRFEEAQKFYAKVGCLDEAIRVLKRLSQNAVVQQRFDDASFYFWTLGKEYLEMIPCDLSVDQLSRAHLGALHQYHTCMELAEIYYAYHPVFRYVVDPFTFTLPESLLNMAKHVYIFCTTRYLPPGISNVYTLYTMAKISRNLGGFKLSRFALERLMRLRLPPKWQDTIDLATVTIRSKSMTDSEDLHVLCYQCTSVNPPFIAKASACPNCNAPYIPSMYSFHNLPIIRFVLSQGISDKAALKLISTDPGSREEVLHHDAARDQISVADSTPMEDGIVTKLSDTNRSAHSLTHHSTTYAYPVFSKKQLMDTSIHDVFIRPSTHLCVPTQYYLHVDAGRKVSMCSGCHQFFLEDEWISEVLSYGRCPFCRLKSVISG